MEQKPEHLYGVWVELNKNNSDFKGLNMLYKAGDYVCRFHNSMSPAEFVRHITIVTKGANDLKRFPEKCKKGRWRLCCNKALESLEIILEDHDKKLSAFDLALCQATVNFLTHVVKED